MSITESMVSKTSLSIKRQLDRIKASPLGYRLAKGVFWSLIGSVIARGLGLVSSICVARMLGKAGFGELGIIQSTLGMFGTFAGFGLGTTATKYVAEYRIKDPLKAGRILMLSEVFALLSGSAVTLLLIIIAPWLATHTLAAPHIAGLLRIGAIFLLLTALNGAQDGTLSGFEAFKVIATRNLLAGIATFPIMVLGAYFWGVTGAVWALTIGVAINWILNNLAIRSECKKANVLYTINDCCKELPIIWMFSLPVVISNILVGPVNWVCNSFLVNQPNGYPEMGIFNAANQWRAAILFIPGTLASIVLPMLSNLHGNGKTQSYKKVLNINLLLTGATASLIALIIIIFARVILRTYGKGFDNEPMTLIWLSFSAILSAVNSVIGQSIISMGRVWIGFLFNSIWALILIISSYVLLKNGLGAEGLALANFISYGIHTLVQGIYLTLLLRKQNTYANI